MPLVYRAANMIDAQLVVDELATASIRARITGGYLSGAIGELPPSEVIGVWLESSLHFNRARAVIEEFEAYRQAAQHADQSGNISHWRCQRCQELIDGCFGACWQCGHQHSEDT